jgi:predicted DNA-binding transcriptional regulator
MMKDRIIGSLILVGGVGFALVYTWLVLFSLWSYYALAALALAAVLGFSGLASWIGYTMATTPQPPTIGELEKEKEDEKPV